MTRFRTFALALALLALAGVPALAQGDTVDCRTDESATLTFLGDPVGNNLALAQDGAEAFMEACPNITVEVVPGPANVNDLLANYLQMFEAESGDVDVLRVDVIWPGIVGPNMIDMSEYLTEEEIEQHFPGYIQNNTVDGRLVAIPYQLGAGMLYYRTDLLEKYGYDAPPATWSELEEMARAIQEGERSEGNGEFWGFVWQGNDYEGLTTNALEWQVSEGGGSIVSPEGEIEVNNEATTRAFERAASWVGDISPPGVTSYQEEDARAVWHAGNAAFMRNWPYAYSISTESEAIGGAFDVAPLPAGDSGNSAAAMGGWQIGVNQYSEHVDAAIAFARYFASYEEAKRRAIGGTLNPTIAALYNDPDVVAAVPFFEGLDAVFSGATPRPSTVTGAQYNEVSTLYSAAVHSILTGEEDAEVALELLELDLMELLGQ